MTAEDSLKRPATRLEWSRIDPDLPPGLHTPKLPGDIGWDLECMADTVIPPMQSVDVPVNARLALPEGFYADIRNRSSMGRRGLYIDQNLIDTGYRGPLFVLIRNMALPNVVVAGQRMFQDRLVEPLFSWATDHGAVTIRAGERIGQLVFHRHHPVWAVEVAEVRTDTVRGEDGFGSTGT